jgi:hypothetical protein
MTRLVMHSGYFELTLFPVCMQVLRVYKGIQVSLVIFTLDIGFTIGINDWMWTKEGG